MSIVVLVAISICLILLFNNSLNPRFCIYAVHQMDGDKTVHLYGYERNGYANFNNPQNDTISMHYLIILLTLNYCTIDTALIIYQHCVHEAECIKLINSTRLFTHRIFPQSFWYQGDIIMIIGLWMSISICLVLLFNNCLNPRFCICAIDKLNDNKTGLLFDYRRQMIPIPIARKMIRYRSTGQCLNKYRINQNNRYKLISLKKVAKSIEQIGSTIDSYNQFWSPIITIDFIGFSLETCYFDCSIMNPRLEHCGFTFWNNSCLRYIHAIKNVDTKWLIDKSQYRSTTIQILYLILLLMLNYITIDSGFIIFRHCVFEAQCTKLINSTRLFTHRIFPQPFWYQGDIIMTIVVWMTISICLINLFNHCLNPRFCIYFIDKVDNNRTNFLFDYKQKMLPISIAQKILRYRSIGRKIVNNLPIATFILAYIFFVQPAWTNSYYQLNELVFYFFILPIILFDLVIVIIPIISFNVINIEYVQIRQWYVKYNQLACLNQHQINEHFRFKLILLKRITESIEQIVLWSPRMNLHLKLKFNNLMMNPRLYRCGFTFWNNGRLHYILLGVLFISFCVITLKVVQFRQWFIIDQCTTNNYQLKKNNWNRMKSINQSTIEMVHICSSIASYNQFWSPVMTVDFLGYSMALCYLAYNITFLTYFIRECVKITRNNAIIENKYRCQLLRSLWSRKTKLERCGFSFWNYWLIDSNCYFVAFYIITVFFMLTFDKQEY
ncbi:hypothetical protein BLOT_012464 [Blomia tropicalis]|nr:hypothetical protein BLOT_012464 [Blomia tropicalis]